MARQSLQANDQHSHSARNQMAKGSHYISQQCGPVPTLTLPRRPDPSTSTAPTRNSSWTNRERRGREHSDLSQIGSWAEIELLKGHEAFEKETIHLSDRKERKIGDEPWSVYEYYARREK